MPYEFTDPYADQRGRSELTKQYPRLSGFLQGLMGTAPDEVGSVFEPELRQGAEYGFPIGVATMLSPAAKALALMTRTGRNIGRVLTPGIKPLDAALEELGRYRGTPAELAVAVSKRGVAGPVRVGTVGSVQPGRQSQLAPAIEDFHTHISDGSLYSLHPGDVGLSKRGRTTVIHADPRGGLSSYRESLANPQAHVTDPERWSYADPQTYRDWLKMRGEYESNVPDELYNRMPWGDLRGSAEGFNAMPMDATYRALKRLNPDNLELAMSRAEQLPEHIDPSRYSPAALARIAALQPAAQRGFSESLIASKAPYGAALIRPSEFLSRADPLLAARDPGVIEKLKPLLGKQGVKELPALWVNQTPAELRAAYEGRHRMKALQEMYGDDPVLLSLLRGSRMEDSTDIMGRLYQKYLGDVNLPSHELLKPHFGDRPIELNPLWRD